MMSRIEYINDGIEIDRGDADLSAGIDGTSIDLAIGEGYDGRVGYERYLEFPLSIEEATALRDWLTFAIDRATAAGTTDDARPDECGSR
jgi:hypothetical protein